MLTRFGSASLPMNIVMKGRHAMLSLYLDNMAGFYVALGLVACVCALFDKRELAIIFSAFSMFAAAVVVCDVAPPADARGMGLACALLAIAILVVAFAWRVGAGSLPKGVCVASPCVVLFTMGMIVASACGFDCFYGVTLVAACAILCIAGVRAFVSHFYLPVMWIDWGSVVKLCMVLAYAVVLHVLCASSLASLLLPMTLLVFAFFASDGIYWLRNTPMLGASGWPFSLCALQMAVLLAHGSYALLVLCVLVLGVVFCVSCKSLVHGLCTLFVAGLAICMLAMLLSGDRLKDWLDAFGDPVRSGYAFVSMADVASSAGLLESAGLLDALRIPGSEDVFSFAVIIVAVGWGGVLLADAAVASIAVVVLRSIDSRLMPCDRVLAYALLAVLLGCAAANLLYVFHVVPLYGVCFPFASADMGSMLLFIGIASTLMGLVSLCDCLSPRTEGVLPEMDGGKDASTS